MPRKIAAATLCLVVAGLVAACRKRARARGDAGDTRELNALPYLELVEAKTDEEGVTVYDRARAAHGLNLFSSQHRSTAFLMDMDGTVVHRWVTDRHMGGVELDPDGNLFVIDTDKGLRKLDFAGNELWFAEARVHHDIDVAADGSIWMLTRETRAIERDGVTYDILDDRIVVATADGVVTDRSLSLYDVIGDRIPQQRLDALAAWLAHRDDDGLDTKVVEDTPYDVFHANAIDWLDRDIPGVARRGQLLLSVREIDTVLILDFDTKQVVWAMDEGLSRQHHPSLLPSDNLLIFDNGVSSNASRVIEVDPTTYELVWQFRGDPPSAFFSRLRGAAQRLPNGNTLITDSANGRAVEVDRDGAVVWELHTAIDRQNSRGQRKVRESVYQVERIVGAQEARLRAMAAEAARP